MSNAVGRKRKEKKKLRDITRGIRAQVKLYSLMGTSRYCLYFYFIVHAYSNKHSNKQLKSLNCVRGQILTLQDTSWRP